MTEQREQSQPSDAAQWDARLRAPDCTSAEREAFRNWCRENPANRRRFDELQAILGGMRRLADAPEVRSMRDAARQVRRRNRMPLAAACAVLLTVGATGWFVLDRWRPDAGAEPVQYATAIGERSTIDLEDGTTVVLNTNTRINVSYSDDTREILLGSGQALFYVAKDAGRPFVVVAGRRRITALGTIFDVRLESDDIEVTLVEGVVEVSADKLPASGGAGAITVDEPVRLAAGQKLSTRSSIGADAPLVEPIDVEAATIWREGRVFFDDMPLSAAVAEMNRYSNIRIHVADSALDRHRVNGMFRTGQQLNFARTLEAYYPLAARRVADDRIDLVAN